MGGCVGGTDNRQEAKKEKDKADRTNKDKLRKDIASKQVQKGSAKQVNTSTGQNNQLNNVITNPPPVKIPDQPKSPQKKSQVQLSPAMIKSKMQASKLSQIKGQQPAPQTAIVKLDSNCPFMSSYISKDQTLFWKTAYNWHSLPLVSQWNFKDPSIFSIKNQGIKFNHFIVGLIRRQDITNLTPTPWLTQGAVCYQSKAQANILHGDKVKIHGKVVPAGQILSMVTRKGNIQFWLGRVLIGRTQIPQSFYMQACLPYVVVFCAGDSFQILKENPLKVNKPK